MLGGLFSPRILRCLVAWCSAATFLPVERTHAERIDGRWDRKTWHGPQLLPLLTLPLSHPPLPPASLLAAEKTARINIYVNYLLYVCVPFADSPLPPLHFGEESHRERERRQLTSLHERTATVNTLNEFKTFRFVEYNFKQLF